MQDNAGGLTDRQTSRWKMDAVRNRCTTKFQSVPPMTRLRNMIFISAADSTPLPLLVLLCSPADNTGLRLLPD